MRRWATGVVFGFAVAMIGLGFLGDGPRAASVDDLYLRFPVTSVATDGAITSSSKTLTSASAPFQSTDVNKPVIVAGAGSGGADLHTVITQYRSTSEVRLKEAASTTVGSATVKVGRTRSAEIASSINPNIALTSAGVKLSDDSDGQLTLLGLGNGSDEDWTINLDDTSNTVTHGTTTGVTLHDWGSIGIGAGSADFTGDVSVVTGSNSKLSIGDATHGPRFELNKDGANSTRLDFLDEGAVDWRFTHLATESFEIEGFDSGETLSLITNAGNIKFSTDADTTTHMVIENGGNVGIGNDNPDVLLDCVGGNIRFRKDDASGSNHTIQFRNGDGTDGNANDIAWQSQDTSADWDNVGAISVHTTARSATGVTGRMDFELANDQNSADKEMGLDGDGNLVLGNDQTVGTNAERVLYIKNGTAPTSSPGNRVALYSADQSGSAELITRDEGGNVTVLSPHAADGPPGMYDRAPGFEEFHRSVNMYGGRVEWYAASRARRLLQQLINGEDLSALPANKRRVYFTETLDQYNTRRGLAEGDRGFLKQEYWTDQRGFWEERPEWAKEKVAIAKPSRN